MNAGATERIDSQVDVCAANDIHVDHVAEIIDISLEVIMTMCCRRAKSSFERNAFHAFQTRFEKLIRLRLDPTGDSCIRRPAIGWVVFEAAIVRRVMRRRDDDPVGEPDLPATVISQDGVRDDRCRGVFIPFRDHHIDGIGG